MSLGSNDQSDDVSVEEFNAMAVSEKEILFQAF